MAYNTRKKFLHLFILFIFLLLPTEIFAVSLTKYREKIQKVSRDLNFLLYPEENLTQSQNLANQKAKISEIQSVLPATEKIELQNGSFEVDNQSILENIKQIEALPYNSESQIKTINETMSKLLALEIKLIELENQVASTRSKDEDKQKLDEILKRPEYQKPEIKKSYFQQLLESFLEWLAKLFPKREMGPQSMGSFEGFSKILQFIVIAVVLAIIGFLIYKFTPFLANRFKNREKKEKKSRVILGETLAEDETSENLFSEAERLAQAGNLRGAVRKGYIALLCELSDRKIIGLAQHKTNRDYLLDVRNRSKLFQNMNALTGSFERYWYGFNSPNQTDWEEFQAKYKQTVSEDLSK